MIGLLHRMLPYALSFLGSLCIMILELVSSRLVARHVGSSLTVWTSVIGIILSAASAPAQVPPPAASTSAAAAPTAGSVSPPPASVTERPRQHA